MPHPATGHFKSIIQWEIDKEKPKASLGCVCKVSKTVNQNVHPQQPFLKDFASQAKVKYLESMNLKLTLLASYAQLVTLLFPCTVREEQCITHVTE